MCRTCFVTDGVREATVSTDEDRARRRAADAQLVALLARDGFAGPAYERFEVDLHNYGRRVLNAWMKSLHIFVKCRRVGLLLSRPPRPFTVEDRSELADHTLASALPSFRQRALIESGWTPDGNASLTTYFVNSLPLHFANPYRAWHRRASEDISWQQRTVPQESAELLAGDPYFTDPALIYVSRETLRDSIRNLDERTRSVLILVAEGYTHAEIGEVYDMTARAVEGVVYRHRKRFEERGVKFD
jgi:DNA-directed RNA polymerase specialized sigma24 family protein